MGKDRPVILLIEDYENAAHISQMALERAGCAVRTASTLAEAGRVLQACGPVDAVVVDDGDGSQLVSALRSLTDVPALVLSSGGTYPRGCVHSLKKPFRLDELCGELNALLQEGRKNKEVSGT